MTSKLLLASDYDGTLKQNGVVSAEDIEAIRRWQEAGNIFCLCTGRCLHSAIEIMEQDSLSPDLLIASNGAAVGKMDGSFLAKTPLTAKETAAIHQIARACGNTAFACNAEDGSQMMFDSLNPARQTATVEQMLAEPHPIQCTAVFKENPPAARLFTDRVNREVEGATAHLNGVYIDCTARGVDKGKGVEKAAEALGIPLENCYTIGDNENDLPMLLPYHGFAIESGNPDTVAKVGRTVPTLSKLIKILLK
ncbi:MAG: HAD-IIB family hydrolase [Clostridia bacterium]|nr:HAD-IIB family hydrolase [Clostridia bacterium]